MGPGDGGARLSISYPKGVEHRFKYEFLRTTKSL
jgi:hypothetical protein